MNGVSRRSGSDRDLPADEAEAAVAQQRARARGPASARTWKPLQIPRTRPPSAANAGDRAHDRAEAGDDAGPQVVAVGEAARQDDAGDARRGPPTRATARPARRRRRAARQAASLSQFEPGKTTTPTRTLIRPARRRRGVDASPEQLDRVRLDERVGEQLAGQPLDDRPRRRLVDGGSTVSSTRRPTRTPATPVDAEVRQARSTARPCGSRIPGLGVTLTAKRNGRARARSSGDDVLLAGSGRSSPR